MCETVMSNEWRHNVRYDFFHSRYDVITWTKKSYLTLWRHDNDINFRRSGNVKQRKWFPPIQYVLQHETAAKVYYWKLHKYTCLHCEKPSNVFQDLYLRFEGLRNTTKSQRRRLNENQGEIFKNQSTARNFDSSSLA